MTVNFADRLTQKIREVGNPLCVGLDPHLDLIPELFLSGPKSNIGRTCAGVSNFLSAVLSRLVGKVAVVKPQIAFFEQMGYRGIATLEEIIQYAKLLGFMVILDAKRGDIGSTAKAYANAYLSKDAAIPVDAITVNPYDGLGTLIPFADQCAKNGKGMFVLKKNDIPNIEEMAELSDILLGDSGWSSLGIVTDARDKDEANYYRKCFPSSLFLVPGYGSQGGSASDAVASLKEVEGCFEGGVINSSRGILFPEGKLASMSDWGKAIDRAVDDTILDINFELNN